MPENNDLLSRMKAEAFNGTNEKDKSISVSEQQNEAEVIGRKSNNAAIIHHNATVIQQYHLDAIKSAQTIQKWAMIIFTFVTIIIAVLIFIVLFNSKLTLALKIIAALTACFVDLLSATIVCLMKSILKSKDKYFESCSKDEELNKMINMVDKMKDDDAKNKMISKLVSSYCLHNKTKD